MKLDAQLVTKVSKKTGNEYTALEIDIGMGIKKLVFLNSAEIAIIQLNK
jgi:hypothetical protein